MAISNACYKRPCRAQRMLLNVSAFLISFPPAPQPTSTITAPINPVQVTQMHINLAMLFLF